MRQIPTPGEKYPYRLYFPELDEIDQICSSALTAHKLLPETPTRIRIDRFIEKHFECAMPFEDLPPGVLGCCGFGPDGKVEHIMVSRIIGDDESQIAQRRVRSTYAHEAGHGLLHGCLFVEEATASLFPDDQAEQKERRILCRGEDIEKPPDRVYNGKWWEFQANRAIGGLLLPKVLVVEAVRPFAREVPPLGALMLDDSRREAAAASVADVFDVSRAAARFRLQEIFSGNPSQNLC